ncbi:unnamed protein product, partial [Mesorhabditis belari]|uniref:Fatty acid desaturase domain-containing protein n=1 Tax=Mesorhabditis belari TaxID=2138241 RepID=A0AAF3J221_9BILA
MCKSNEVVEQEPQLAAGEFVCVDDIDFCDREFEESRRLEFQAGFRRRAPRWVARNVLLFGIMHSMALVGLYHAVVNAKWYTLALAQVCWTMGILGITTGAHRLWSHRSFKAETPFRVMLMLFQTAAGQNSLYEWVRDHRCHHKWTDTDADPHNASRGLFFAHIGWLLQRKDKAVIEKGRQIDMSDLLSDPVIVFQKKFYFPLWILLCILLPTAIPVYFWGEDPSVAYFVVLARYVLSLHETWTINSLAHSHGDKPYDGRIRATDSPLMAMVTYGEGGHNYHHTFPSDYRTSEFNYCFNAGKILIDLGATIGQVYDRKVVGEEFIQRRIAANETMFGKSEYYAEFASSWKKTS